MEIIRHKLTMDRPATYEIKVPGELDASWADWFDQVTITCDPSGTGPPVTILTGAFDQAALQGLLRKLYAQGLPLISVTWSEGDRETKENEE